MIQAPPQTEVEPEYFLIRHHQRNGPSLWWREGRTGYTEELLCAGAYTKTELAKCAIRTRDNEDEVIPLRDVLAKLDAAEPKDRTVRDVFRARQEHLETLLGACCDVMEVVGPWGGEDGDELPARVCEHCGGGSEAGVDDPVQAHYAHCPFGAARVALSGAPRKLPEPYPLFCWDNGNAYDEGRFRGPYRSLALAEAAQKHSEDDERPWTLRRCRALRFSELPGASPLRQLEYLQETLDEEVQENGDFAEQHWADWEDVLVELATEDPVEVNAVLDAIFTTRVYVCDPETPGPEEPAP